MPLDPIVSLAVQLAEAPGTCACLLGAGVSVDAGVPTGWAIYRDGLRRLYRLENKTSDTPEDKELDAWLETTGRKDLGYSALLDLIAPDQAVRRSLLAGYFDGVEPGLAHERLAELAVRGLLRVLVTTNFDRLLERALIARGIEPVVVSDDATVAAAPHREHAPVYIVKAHGDYLQETLRNTPFELAQLEPDLTAEIQAIANNYGLFVLGWSGSDPALADILRSRRSRYGVWWLSLSDTPAEPARSLAEAIGARIIVRPGGAAETLAELDRRVAVYESHDSGHDPGSVHDEARAVLRRGDEVGLDELLRREQYEFESVVDAVTADHVDHHDNAEHVRDAWNRLEAATQRRLASLMPLALHRPELLESTLRAHAGWATRTPLQGGSMTWQQAWVLPFWTIGMTLGGLLVRLERYEALKPILATTWTNHYGQTEPLIGHPGDTGVIVASVFGPSPREGRQWWFPFWTWLAHALPQWTWLTERYPDWLRRDGEPDAALAEFGLLLCIAEGLRDGGQQIALWSLNAAAGSNYARRLHADSRLRTQAAEAVGTTLAVFDEKAPEIVAESYGVGIIPNVRETANILRTGSYR
jgi:hypothetical protein